MLEMGRKIEAYVSFQKFISEAPLGHTDRDIAMRYITDLKVEWEREKRQRNRR